MDYAGEQAHAGRNIPWLLWEAEQACRVVPLLHVCAAQLSFHHGAGAGHRCAFVVDGFGLRWSRRSEDQRIRRSLCALVVTATPFFCKIDICNAVAAVSLCRCLTVRVLCALQWSLARRWCPCTTSATASCSGATGRPAWVVGQPPDGMHSL